MPTVATRKLLRDAKRAVPTSTKIVEKAPRPADCIHLGVVQARSDAQGRPVSCEGKWLRSCDIHGICRVNEVWRYKDGREGANCQKCKQYWSRTNPDEPPRLQDKPLEPVRRMQTLILRCKQGLGDTLGLSALVRDIGLRYGSQYRLMIDSHFRSLWINNPYVMPMSRAVVPAPLTLEIGYSGAVLASKSGQNFHFLRGFHQSFTAKSGLTVPLTQPKPYVVLSPDELRPRISGRYWVVVAGGKLDMTVKHWPVDRYQAVVDRLRPYGLQFVQVGAKAAGHTHPRLTGALNAVGQTEEPRDLCSLIAGSDGVICPITSAMHIAAAFDKPCIVLAGGREDPSFISYTNAYPGAFGDACAPVAVEHRFLHTIGLLHCCAKACWKKKTVPIEPKDLTTERGRVCLEPVRVTGKPPVPLCMSMIEVDHVLEAVMSYYEQGVLPPVGQPQRTYPMLEAPVVPPEPQFLRTPTIPPKAGRLPTILPTEVPKAPTVLLTPNAALDHPLIGGRFTVFVLCYGDHLDLAKRCLDSILATTTPNRIDLRVATNEACADTIRYLRGLPLSHLYVNETNRLKYPVMREMFWDEKRPIETQHLVWFDDDSFVVDPHWLQKLAECVVTNHPHRARLYGWKHFHDLRMFAKHGNDPKAWFEQGRWWRGRNLRVRGSQTEAPNGSQIFFVPGSFWAVHTETMRRADIPDVRLGHNGGDIAIGAQIHQAGFEVADFNRNKTIVFMSGAPRRGHVEEFQWAWADRQHLTRAT